MAAVFTGEVGDPSIDVMKPESSDVGEMLSKPSATGDSTPGTGVPAGVGRWVGRLKFCTVCCSGGEELLIAIPLDSGLRSAEDSCLCGSFETAV
jgi:hypothetical protein